jgi:hypothetical protein
MTVSSTRADNCNTWQRRQLAVDVAPKYQARFLMCARNSPIGFTVASDFTLASTQPAESTLALSM